MAAETPLPDDDPRKLAWEGFKLTDEYANSRRWAKHTEITYNQPHLDGSLWAMFIAGWEAGARHALQHSEEIMNIKDQKQDENPIERTAVKSTNVKSVGYCPDRKCIEVEFNGGGVYRYHDCDQDLFDRLMKAESVGKFVNANIKPSKKFTKL